MKRELSRVSRISAPASKLEEGGADEFDLDDFLNGLSSDQSSAGHVNKNLGLVWKDLTVMVRFSKQLRKKKALHELISIHRVKLQMLTQFLPFSLTSNSGNLWVLVSVKTRRSS